jgi:hypothetical protein
MPAPRRARTPRWLAALPWALWALALLGLAAAFWLHRLLVQAGRPELMSFDPPLVIAGVTAATVGAVLASRRPAHPVGWLLLAFGVAIGVDGVAAAVVHYPVPRIADPRPAAPGEHASQIFDRLSPPTTGRAMPPSQLHDLPVFLTHLAISSAPLERTAITDDASPFALRSTRNRPRTALH